MEKGSINRLNRTKQLCPVDRNHNLEELTLNRSKDQDHIWPSGHSNDMEDRMRKRFDSSRKISIIHFIF